MFRVWILGVLVVVLGMTVFLSRPVRAAANGQSPAQADVVVMSFNIRYGAAQDGENRWERRKNLACDLVRRHAPDLVGLQEALRLQIDDLRATLPEYGEIGVGRDDGKTRGEYSAILYRRDRFTVAESGTFWLSDTPEVPGSITWGNACTRICTWARFLPQSGRPFYLFNTHLDHISQCSREKGIALIVSRLVGRRHPDPIVLTGDFNIGENNPVVHYLKGEQPLQGANNSPTRNPLPLMDSFRRLHPDATEVGTFHGFKGDHSGDKIDYIFVPSDVQVLQAEILRDHTDNRYPADHFPILAALHFADQTVD